VHVIRGYYKVAMSTFLINRKQRLQYIKDVLKLIKERLSNRNPLVSSIAMFIISLCFNQAFGQNLEFAKNISGSNDLIEVQHMLTDASGNIYLAGEFDGNQTIDFDPSSGSGVPRPRAGGLNSDAYNDLFVAKYNSAGEYQWVMAIYTANNTSDPNLSLGGISLDGSGNLYVAGHVDGTTGAHAYFATTGFSQVYGTTSTGNDFRSPFVISLDANGDENWTYNPNIGVAQMDVTGVATYSSSVYFFGYYTNGSPLSLPSTSDPIQNAYVVEIATSDATFQDSERLMTSITGGSSYIRIRDVEMDASGNMYLTGVFQNNVEFDPGTGTAYIDGGSSGKTFVAKHT
jgi:hypothetical protein